MIELRDKRFQLSTCESFTPCLAAMPPRVSPDFTVYVLVAELAGETLTAFPAGATPLSFSFCPG